MQAGMDKLSAFLERRRLVVLGAWILLLVAVAPFAAWAFAASSGSCAVVTRRKFGKARENPWTAPGPTGRAVVLLAGV
jgi:hypothetical protein